MKKKDLKCKQCGYVWIPILPLKDVRICPRCKSSQWDNDKSYKKYGRKRNDPRRLR